MMLFLHKPMNNRFTESSGEKNFIACLFILYFLNSNALTGAAIQTGPGVKTTHLTDCPQIDKTNRLSRIILAPSSKVHWGKKVRLDLTQETERKPNLKWVETKSEEISWNWGSSVRTVAHSICHVDSWLSGSAGRLFSTKESCRRAQIAGCDSVEPPQRTGRVLLLGFPKKKKNKLGQHPHSRLSRMASSSVTQQQQQSSFLIH